MKPRLLAVSAVCSLLLLFAAVALWVRSYFVDDLLYKLITEPSSAHTMSSRTINLGSCNGGVFYSNGVDTFKSPAPKPRVVERGWQTMDSEGYPGRSTGLSDAQFNFGGFVFLSRDYQWPVRGLDSERARIHSTSFSWVVPYWAITLITALPAAWFTSRWRREARRRSRLRHGLCPRCGYDLRAAGSARCPECGEPAIPSSGSPTVPIQAPSVQVGRS